MYQRKTATKDALNNQVDQRISQPLSSPTPPNSISEIKPWWQICKLCMYPTAYSILIMIDKTPSPAECLSCQGQNACNTIPFFKENNWTFGNKLAALDTLHPIRAYNSFKQSFRYGLPFLPKTPQQVPLYYES